MRSTQWPNWICKNCHRQFPKDTKYTKCPGQLSPGPDKRMLPCGGPLIRWRIYEEKH